MEPTQRRGFLRLASTTAVGIPLANAFGFSLSGPEPTEFLLHTAEVKRGLAKGLRFRSSDQRVLDFVTRFSSRQVLIGGGVLTLAANRPTETVHLLVQLDDLEQFVASLDGQDAPWAEAYSSFGNVLSFEHDGQHYRIETLVEQDFNQRLAMLDKPGAEANGSRVEFAHDGICYDLQRKRFHDPYGVLDGPAQVELVQLASPNGMPSAIRILVEEKSLGLRVSEARRNNALKSLRRGIRDLDESERKHFEMRSHLARLDRYATRTEKDRIMA